MLDDGPRRFGVRLRKVVGRLEVFAVTNDMDADGSQSDSDGLCLDGPLLRPEDAARLLAVKPNWIYEAVRDGRLPCLRLGRHIRFTRSMLERWLADKRP